MPAHLRPTAPTAADAILCGDPARALAIAQRVMVQPRMSNHHRGLWGYHGLTHHGRELTIQATGIGGPSAAVVLHELAALGVKRAIRVGTCRSMGEEPRLGARLVVERVEPIGMAAAVIAGSKRPLLPDAQLTAAFVAAGATPLMSIGCAELFYPEDAAAINPPRRPAAIEDLQTATLLALGPKLGVAMAVGLIIATAGGRRLEDEPLEAALLDLAAVAATALGSDAQTRAEVDG